MVRTLHSLSSKIDNDGFFYQKNVYAVAPSLDPEIRIDEAKLISFFLKELKFFVTNYSSKPELLNNGWVYLRRD